MHRNNHSVVLGTVLLVFLGVACRKAELKEPPYAVTILDGLPTVETDQSVVIMSNSSAQVGGSITDAGGTPITARGLCWATGQTPTMDDMVAAGLPALTGTGSFTASMGQLQPAVMYHARVFAVNHKGIAYGDEVVFFIPTVPVVAIAAVTGISDVAATVGGLVSSTGNGTVTGLGVQYGTDTITLSEAATTPQGDGTGPFSILLNGLNPGTLYHVRAFATNAVGTAYGGWSTFITSVRDVDGNVYKVVKIGDQYWMAENLRTITYDNSDPLETAPLETDWFNLSSGAWAGRIDLFGNWEDYGRLYNHYATTDIRNVCPAGWSVPTNVQWDSLITYLGGYQIAGGSMKADTDLWTAPNTGATNTSGFNGVPAGLRTGSGSYDLLSFTGYWWSRTDAGPTADHYELKHNSSSVIQGSGPKNFGYSIRCIKD